MVNFEALTRYKIVVVYPHFSKLNSWQSEITFCSNHDLRGRSQSDVVHCKKPGARCCREPTVFALGDVAAFIASLGVCGVAPGADAIPIWVPAVVQLQTISGCGGPPEMNRDRAAVTAQPHSDYILDFKKNAYWKILLLHVLKFSMSIQQVEPSSGCHTEPFIVSVMIDFGHWAAGESHFKSSSQLYLNI